MSWSLLKVQANLGRWRVFFRLESKEGERKMQSDIGILALGNLLRRDEGVGIHVLNRLREELPFAVEILDGGTSGLELLGFFESKRHIIILDAVDAGVAPGEVVEWKREEIPVYATGKLSLHQMSFAEVLYWAQFTGGIPEEIVVIGVQPDCLDWGTDLTEKTENSMPEAVERVLACLNRWNAGKLTGSRDCETEESP